jgi:CheY-like chemotaxis protein
MAGPYAIRALVVDGDASLRDDYKRILSPAAQTRDDSLFAQLEGDLIGAAVGHKRFPEIDVVAVVQGRDAVETVRAALDEGRPFAVAFIDLYLASGLDGLRTAEQVRALDPEIHIVLVAAKAEVHPVEMSERVPPADQLFFVSKPFHAAEIQQLVLSLAARWRGERWQFGGDRTRAGGLALGRGGLPEVLDRLPAGALVFDRRDRLLAANDAMCELFPELAELLVAGTSYEEIQRGAAERLLPENTLMRVDAWLAERMEWHLRSGGAIEQRLRGARWVLLIEEASTTGETFCLYYDVTDLKRRESSRATSAHMTQMAQSFAALCEQFDDLAGAGRAGVDSAFGSRRGGGPDVAVLPGAIAGSPGSGHLQSLAGRLQAIAQRQKLAPEPLGMNRVVGEVARKLRGELDTDVQMEVIAGAGLWPILIDGDKFEVALAELVRNACEAMESGGRLTVETVNIRLTSSPPARAWPPANTSGSRSRTPARAWRRSWSSGRSIPSSPRRTRMRTWASGSAWSTGSRTSRAAISRSMAARAGAPRSISTSRAARSFRRRPSKTRAGTAPRPRARRVRRTSAAPDFTGPW